MSQRAEPIRYDASVPTEEELKTRGIKPIGSCTLEEVVTLIKSNVMDCMCCSEVSKMDTVNGIVKNSDIETMVVVPKMFLAESKISTRHEIETKFEGGELILTYTINNMVLDSPCLFSIFITTKPQGCIGKVLALATTFTFPAKGVLNHAAQKGGSFTEKMRVFEPVDSNGNRMARKVVFKIRADPDGGTMTAAAA